MKKPDTTRKLTKAEAGRLGGMATKQRHGAAHYRAAGKKGAQATLAKHGPEHMRVIGRRGFAAMAEAYFGSKRNPRQSATVYLRGRGALPPDPATIPPDVPTGRVEIRPRTIEQRDRDLAEARAILARHANRQEEPPRE
jgi:hypothetical protein